MLPRDTTASPLYLQAPGQRVDRHRSDAQGLTEIQRKTRKKERTIPGYCEMTPVNERNANLGAGSGQEETRRLRKKER